MLIYKYNIILGDWGKWYFVVQLISLFLIRQLYEYNSLYVYGYATYYENKNIMIMMLLTVAFIGRSSHITLTAYLF